MRWVNTKIKDAEFKAIAWVSKNSRLWVVQDQKQFKLELEKEIDATREPLGTFKSLKLAKDHGNNLYKERQDS